MFVLDKIKYLNDIDMEKNDSKDSVGDCPICLSAIIVKCRTKCGHEFCKSCIIKLMVPNIVSTCPYCRTEVSMFDITIDGENKLLIEKQPPTLTGSVYVQGRTLGLASYHFESLEDCYISYASPQCSEWPSLDDGSRPVEKKTFLNPVFNEESREFTGIIDWSPRVWQGDQQWHYRMIFSADFEQIIDGEVISYDSSGHFNNNIKFGFGLFYSRYYLYPSLENIE